MIVKLTGRFVLKGKDDVYVVEWLEENLPRKQVIGGEEQIVPLTLDDIMLQYRKLFITYKKRGDVFTAEMVNGGLAIVDFNEVQFATVFGEVVEDGKAEA